MSRHSISVNRIAGDENPIFQASGNIFRVSQAIFRSKRSAQKSFAKPIPAFRSIDMLSFFKHPICSGEYISLASDPYV